MGGEPSERSGPGALPLVRATLARLAAERERTGAHCPETWAALCRHLERLSPEDARRVSDAVRQTLAHRPGRAR